MKDYKSLVTMLISHWGMVINHFYEAYPSLVNGYKSIVSRLNIFPPFPKFSKNLFLSNTVEASFMRNFPYRTGDITLRNCLL